MAKLTGAARNSAMLRVSTEIAKAFISSGAYDVWTAERVSKESHEVACALIDRVFGDEDDFEV